MTKVMSILLVLSAFSLVGCGSQESVTSGMQTAKFQDDDWRRRDGRARAAGWNHNVFMQLILQRQAIAYARLQAQREAQQEAARLEREKLENEKEAKALEALQKDYERRVKEYQKREFDRRIARDKYWFEGSARELRKYLPKGNVGGATQNAFRYFLRQLSDEGPVVGPATVDGKTYDKIPLIDLLDLLKDKEIKEITPGTDTHKALTAAIEQLVPAARKELKAIQAEEHSWLDKD